MILPDLKNFLRHHWQKKPLLIKQALPGFKPLLSPDELMELASRDEVESRILQRSGKKWTLAHGPFGPDDFPSLKKKNWTLLVQGVDLHVDAVHALQQQFRFIPDARLDDLMISLASDQGGVGPHYDSYDVFLLQAWGRREWRIGPLKDRVLVPDAPVKLLAHFEPVETLLLDAGDMLYLPPGWGHDGIAQGPCMTYSIGFRSPTRAEFLQAFFNDCSDRVDECNDDALAMYGDPDLRPVSNPAHIPPGLGRHLEKWVRQAVPTKEDVQAFIGRFLSEPKNNVWFDTPAPMLSPQRFFARASRSGVRLQRASRLLLRPAGKDSGTAFFNGEHQHFEGQDWQNVSKLAEFRSFVAPPQLLDTVFGKYLYTAYSNGWLSLL